MPTRTLLFLLTRAPYADSRALETLEAILVAGVFEQSVRVLFRDDAVWGLLPGQNGALLGQRTFGKVVTSLAAYDVDDLFVCAASLTARGLAADALVVPAQPLDFAAQAELIAASDAVFGSGA